MADLARIKKNVAKMAAMNAPESDIDGYIASEGVTVDDVRNYQSLDKDVLGAVTTFDKGYTGGFGRKIGGVINALGAGAVDANIETLKPILNAFGANISDDVKNKDFSQAFADRYNEIVDPALKASEKFEGANPKTALALNIGGAVVSPINKLGAGYINKGATTLSKLARSSGVGAGIGGVYGAGRTENLEDLATNIAEDAQMGAAFGVAAPLAIQGLKGVVSKIRPQNALAGKATGLEAAIKDGDSVKMLKRGIQADDAIANQIKEEAPVAMNSLNERMRNALNRLTGRKIDIDQANVNQQNRMKEFVNKNANKELYSSKNAKQQADENFAKWFKGSQIVDENGKPLELYHGTSKVFDSFSPEMRGNLTGAESAKKGFWLTSGKDTARSYADFSKEKSELSTLLRRKEAMDKNPGFSSPSTYDEVVNRIKELQNLPVQDEQRIISAYVQAKNPKVWDAGGRKYMDIQKDINELIASSQDNDAIVIKNLADAVDTNAVPEAVTHVMVKNPNQIKSVNNSGAWSKSASLSDAGWMPKASVDSYTYDFNQFQKDALKQALGKGAYMSTNAKGTLGATHRAQEVLNDMIEASYDTSIIGQKKPTTETRQLMQVKERLNQMLEPSGIKPYDAGLSKAKALEAAYEKGYKFKPSETKFEALGLEKARDKRAFLQGRIASILDNVKEDKNIAKAIQADENTLRKLMPEGQYRKLLKEANQISTEYERVRSLAGQAEKQVVKPEPAGRPMSEITETRGAIKGSLLDALNRILMTESNKKAANILLGNEKAVRSRLFDALQKTPDYALTPYLVDVLSQNK